MNNKDIDILLLSDNSLHTVGGEQESTKIIINAIKNEYNVGMIQPGKIDDFNSEINFYYLTDLTRIKHLIKRPISFLRYINNVRKIITTTNPRIIHTQSQVSFFIVALLKKTRMISKNNYLIHTERGLYTKYNIFFKKIFIFLFKELNTLVTTTHFNMNYWKEALKDRYKHIEYRIIENTAGEMFEVYDEKLEKRKDDKITIGFAGRYTEWKNWPLAREISEQLNDLLGENLKIKMAVGCLDQKSIIETQTMFNNLKLILGDRFEGQININMQEMNKFYYDIDVFVLTSNFNTESFGRTLVEAMSRKSIVLTTNSGGSVEVIGNQDNVHESATEFVEKIIEYQTDSLKMNLEKEANLKRVKEVYSFQSNITKHLIMYSKNFKNED